MIGFQFFAGEGGRGERYVEFFAVIDCLLELIGNLSPASDPVGFPQFGDVVYGGAFILYPKLIKAPNVEASKGVIVAIVEELFFAAEAVGDRLMSDRLPNAIKVFDRIEDWQVGRGKVPQCQQVAPLAEVGGKHHSTKHKVLIRHPIKGIEKLFLLLFWWR